MKRNVTVSIAAGLLAATVLAQANDLLVAGAFASENVIVDSAGGAGARGGAVDDWKEQYPFPRHFGPID